MNSDIRLNISWLSHPKRQKLERRLGAKGALSFLDLLLAVAQNKPDGVLSGWNNEDIALAAQWNGDPEEFVSILIEIKLIDRNPDRNVLSVHDWEQHNPYASKAQLRTERARKGAAAKWGICPDNETQTKINRSQRLREARSIGTHTHAEWDEMKSFFKNRCVRCGGCGESVEIVKDHIVPFYQGGSDGIENIQPLCRTCNASKGPENIDYRIEYCNSHAVEIPTKWFSDACLMPANACLDACSSPSPSPTPNPKETKNTIAGSVNGNRPACGDGNVGALKTRQDTQRKEPYSAEFETAWKNHGRQDGSKYRAFRKWTELKKQKALPELATVLDAQNSQKLSKKWREGFIPYFQTWLNDRRWEEDQYEPERGGFWNG